MPVTLSVLFVVAMMPIVVAWISGYYRKKQFGRFDNEHPRLQQSQLTGVGARAVAAQANCWESLQTFAVVVLIAVAVGVDLARLEVVSLAFLILRVLYVAFYLTNLATLRSVTYGLGLFCCIYVFGVASMAAVS